MKIQHLTILFAAILFAIMLIFDIKTSTLNRVLEEKEKMDAAMNTAIDDSVDTMSESYTKRSLMNSREEGMSAFFLSLYSSLGITSDVVSQQKLREYMPVIVITDNEGLYVFFHDEYVTSTGISTLSMRWSERFPYTYEDDYFIISFTMGDTIKLYDKQHLLFSDNVCREIDVHEFQVMDEGIAFRREHPDYFLLNDESFYLVKKSTIIQTINEKMKYYINAHNSIAVQYGITYEFAMPVVDELVMLRSVEQPGIIVVFQGYPIRGTSYYYNRVEVAGASIYKEDTYYLEEKGWYKVYHVASCEEVGTNPYIDTSDVYYNVRDCVEQGAYACEKCCPDGVHVPEYRLN